MTYSASGPFTKNREEIQNFKGTGDSRYVCQNELDKACFQHGMAYGDFKDLTRRELLIEYYVIKHLKIAKIRKYDGYQRGLTLMVYKYFDKKSVGGSIKNEITSNKELAGEVHKPVIRKVIKRKVHLSLIDNIWGADLADTQLISKFNKGLRFLWYVFDIYNKYVGGYSINR